MYTQQLRNHIEDIYPSMGNLLPSERNRILIAAVAMHQANSRGLPTTAVESPEAYWRAQFQSTVEEIFYALNECFVFDTKRAIDLSRSMWLSKYSFVFDMDTVGSWSSQEPLSYFDRAAGATAYFGVEDIAFLNKHAFSIRNTAVQLKAILIDHFNKEVGL